MPKHTIIGMAGHIDHGKTALIKALTGLETDRRPEEKQRGITIDIGFAYWRDNVTIIDVPGHEKFVHNMVAGVSTVDFFLLVIAADDGIMPQTREHFDILRFFGVKQGIVALNKIDLVDEEWLQLVQNDVRQYLDEQDYGHIPIVPVSSVSGKGVDQLRRLIMEKIDQLQDRREQRPFRLNIDRHFLVHGYGDVVTGTVLSGKVNRGASVISLPRGVKGKVRSLQVHQKEVSLAESGQRAAINLSGFDGKDIQRGAVLLEGKTLELTQELLAVVRTTSYYKFKVKRYRQVRVHLGTAEYNAQLDWFEEQPALQNEALFHIRLKFKEPAVAAPQDAVLIRSLSPAITLAGGRVLQINPPKIKRSSSHWPEYFSALEQGALSEEILLRLQYAAQPAFSLKDLCRLNFRPAEAVEQSLEGLLKKKKILRLQKEDASYFLLTDRLQKLVENIAALLQKHAQENPHQPGLNFNELSGRLQRGKVQSFVLQRALERAEKQERIFLKNEFYYPAELKETVAGNKHLQEVERLFEAARFTPPDVQALSKTTNLTAAQLRPLITQLVKEKKLISIGGKFYVHHSVFSALIDYLKNHFAQNETIAVAGLRDFTRSTRKFLIPLLEYLDLEGYTARDGDVRRAGFRL